MRLSRKQKLSFRMRRYARLAAASRLQGNIRNASHWDDQIEKVYADAKRHGFSEGFLVQAEEKGRQAGARAAHRDRDPARARDTHRFTSAERSGRAGTFHRLAKRGGSHTYATPEVKRTASYKRAERLEEQIAPRRWSTPGLSRSQYERLADAWERAGFLGWADNYRAHVEHHRIGRDLARHHHRTKGAPSFRQQRFISRKIEILVREGYPPKQAAAIAYRMAGVPPRSSRRRRRH